MGKTKRAADLRKYVCGRDMTIVRVDVQETDQHHNNNNNNITSMALKSSEARAQKRNKTKSVIIFKSRGHTGVIISFKGPPTI